MTDIVKRLHRERETDHLAIEAAAEIERFEAEIERLTDWGGEKVVEICELRADNERLRTQGVHLADALYAGQQETERLQAVLRYISQLDDDGEAPVLARRALEPKP